MRQVNMHEAKTTLSQLVEAVEAGERVVIARAGQPAVELVRVRNRTRSPRIGGLRGRIPAKLIDAVAEPWSGRELEAMFGGGLEP